MDGAGFGDSNIGQWQRASVWNDFEGHWVWKLAKFGFGIEYDHICDWVDRVGAVGFRLGEL